MSQDWTDNVYDKDAFTAHAIMSNIELMFATLKSLFSGTGQPSNAVAGMPWFDTTPAAEAFKIRNEDNDAWITIFDFANFRIFCDIIAEKTAAAGVTVDSVILKDGNVEVGAGGQVKTGIIVEKVVDDGVLVDSMLIKDGEITSSGLPTDGTTLVKIQHGTIMLPFYMSEDETAISGPSQGQSWEAMTNVPLFKVYIPTDATALRCAMNMARSGSGSNHILIRFVIGGLNSSYSESTNSGYNWRYEPYLDVSSLSGWYDITFESYYQGGSGSGVIKGFSFVWE